MWPGPNTPRERNAVDAGGDDMPPSGEEARAQRLATSMPLVWLALGLIVVLLFALLMTVGPSSRRSSKGQTAASAPAQSLPPRNQVAN
jgi:hypothetical protein